MGIIEKLARLEELRAAKDRRQEARGLLGDIKSKLEFENAQHQSFFSRSRTSER